MHISTVRIRSVETASGFIVINEADFDPSKPVSYTHLTLPTKLEV